MSCMPPPQPHTPPPPPCMPPTTTTHAPCHVCPTMHAPLAMHTPWPCTPPATHAFPPVDRITDACENITLSKHSVNNIKGNLSGRVLHLEVGYSSSLFGKKYQFLNYIRLLRKGFLSGLSDYFQFKKMEFQL